LGSRREIAISAEIMEYMDIISPRELNTLERVLENYNMEIINVSKVRSAYKVTTKTGIKCLKRIKHGREKPKKVYHLTQYLLSRGFKNVALFNKTADDKLYVKHKGSYFYMTDWIDGRECDLNDFYLLKKSVELMADFHMAASGQEGRDYFNVSSNLKKWPAIYIKRCNDLIKYSRLINKKRIKSKFDIEYEKAIDINYRKSLIAVDILNKSDYYNLCRKSREERTICHDSFYYQNLIVDNDNNIYLIDLDSVVQDILVHDLGKLIRRILYKEAYKWDFEIAKEMIEAYNSRRSLSYEELEVMLAIIIFPHKFWKLGRKRYEKHKLWSEEKYMNKLNKLISYLNPQTEFVRKYADYYNIDVNINS